MSFSFDIKKIRKHSLMSQEAFAQALGVSFTTVNRWECGKTRPSLKTIKLIDEFCKANGINFDTAKLLMEDGEINEHDKVH